MPDLVALIDTTSDIFTFVLVSSMLEDAPSVKKQKQRQCRIIDMRKEPVEKDA